MVPPAPSPLRRSAGLVITLMASAGLALQLGIFLSAAWSKGETGWGTTANFFSFFTVLTNLLVVIVFAAPGAFWRAPWVQGGVTIHIAVVGLVYELLLRRLWQPEGAQFIADLLLHDAVPLVVAAHWLLLRERGALRWRHAFLWLAYPGIYLAYTLLRGSFTGWWPFPFLDAAALGFARVGLNASGLMALFIGLGLGLVAWDRRRNPRII